MRGGGDHGGQPHAGAARLPARGRAQEQPAGRAGRSGRTVPEARGQDSENPVPGGSGPRAVPAGGPGAAASARDGRERTVPRQPDAAAMDDPEFREYVAARGRSLLRTAYLLTGNSADAEDLLQSVLAKTYQAWDRIEDRSAIDGYVRRAIVNTHISWWRRRRLNEYPTDEIPDQPVADPSRDSDLQDSVRRAIDRLPQRMRAAVLLRFYEDMTEAQIAARLGVSVGTVKSTVSRAVAKLRIDEELLAD